MGALDLKGIVEPVRAWRLAGLNQVGKGQVDRPFVGRETELEQFRASLDICKNRRAGQVILLRGEAGIGKTRLTEEVERMAEHDDEFPGRGAGHAVAGLRRDSSTLSGKRPDQLRDRSAHYSISK